MAKVRYYVLTDYDASEHPGSCYGWKIIKAETGATVKMSRSLYGSRDQAIEAAKYWAEGEYLCSKDEIY